MKLFLLRHSVPDYGDWDGVDITQKPDDPPLSDEGVEYVENLAKWMLDTETIPNVIWASPRLRTQQTAEIVRDALGLPSVDTRGSMGSDMSIRKMVLKACGDKSLTRVMLVSHHESIAQGLVALNQAAESHADKFAMAELRMYRVARKDGTWEEHLRLPPSDLGGWDRY